MKSTKRGALHLLSLAATLVAATSPIASAGSVLDLTVGADGLPYRKLVTLDLLDSAAFTRHVGAWSWQDSNLFEPGEDPVGWTHQSDWVQITLTSPTSLTLRMERQEGVQVTVSTIASTASMFPSFTLWSGWDTDGTVEHMYNNDGNIATAEDITYVSHFANSTQPTAEYTFLDLPAGNYTLVLGSNSPATDTARQGYLATFATVPEPASALFLLSGFTALGFRRSRVQG
jgi:hypothetical protein